MIADFQEATDPLNLFRDWMALAEKSETNDPNAAALATATSVGVPSVRMVLIKGVDERGLRFFTNSESQKGQELHQNPVASVCFHWKSLRRQVRFSGEVRVLSHEETDAYFHSRSRASQIAAAVSRQSRPLPSREVLEDSVKQYAALLGDSTVPLPDDWTGFLLIPEEAEFWLDGKDRLHNRLQFARTGSTWTRQLLYP